MWVINELQIMTAQRFKWYTRNLCQFHHIWTTKYVYTGNYHKHQLHDLGLRQCMLQTYRTDRWDIQMWTTLRKCTYLVSQALSVLSQLPENSKCGISGLHARPRTLSVWPCNTTAEDWKETLFQSMRSWKLDDSYNTCSVPSNRSPPLNNSRAEPLEITT